MDISSFTGGIIAGLFICMFLAYRLLAKISQIVEAEQQKPQALIESDISCKIEEVNGMFYVWEVDSNEFVVQGRSIKEMQDLLVQMNKKFNLKIVEGEKSTIEKLKATAST